MHAQRPVERAPALVMEDDVPVPRGIEPAGWVAVGVGFGLAGLTEALPILRAAVGYMVVLVHEMGHAVAGWLFGYPSIPAFDFRYGGGVTLHQEQAPLLVGLVYALLVFLVWVFRSNRPSLGLVIATIAVYSALVFTKAHDAVVLAMGHGGELLFAALFSQAAAFAFAQPLQFVRIDS